MPFLVYQGTSNAGTLLTASEISPILVLDGKDVLTFNSMIAQPRLHKRKIFIVNIPTMKQTMGSSKDLLKLSRPTIPA